VNDLKQTFTLRPELEALLEDRVATILASGFKSVVIESFIDKESNQRFLRVQIDRNSVSGRVDHRPVNTVLDDELACAERLVNELFTRLCNIARSCE